MMIPVILAGGVGSRLWPLSRELHPKQLLKLTGEYSLLQMTVLRAVRVSGASHIILVVNDQQRFLIQAQIDELALEADVKIVLEPMGKNTAPAVALAALLVDPADVLWVMPADHVLEEKGLADKLESAKLVAQAGYLTTFGIEPRYAETGYGYIQANDAILDAALCVRQFIEKPDAKRAQVYCDEGGYFWNSGMFVFTASAYLSELKQYQPSIHQYCLDTVNSSYDDLAFIRFDELKFVGCPNVSIDYAVMERTRKAAMVPLTGQWSDVGSWTSLCALEDKDDQGNALIGDVMDEGCRNSYIRSESKLIAAIGLSDTIVVETPDAILVADKQQDQAVKAIVKQLERDNRIESAQHKRQYKPWGYVEVITDGQSFIVNRVMIKPGMAMSLQRHQQRAEHWVVLQGVADVVRGEDALQLQVNQSINIPANTWHQLLNNTANELIVIEVQTGVIDDGDIERKQSMAQAKEGTV